MLAELVFFCSASYGFTTVCSVLSLAELYADRIRPGTGSCGDPLLVLLPPPAPAGGLLLLLRGQELGRLPGIKLHFSFGTHYSVKKRLFLYLEPEAKTEPPVWSGLMLRPQPKVGGSSFANLNLYFFSVCRSTTRAAEGGKRVLAVVTSIPAATVVSRHQAAPGGPLLLHL